MRVSKVVGLLALTLALGCNTWPYEPGSTREGVITVDAGTTFAGGLRIDELTNAGHETAHVTVDIAVDCRKLPASLAATIENQVRRAHLFEDVGRSSTAELVLTGKIVHLSVALAGAGVRGSLGVEASLASVPRHGVLWTRTFTADSSCTDEEGTRRRKGSVACLLDDLRDQVAWAIAEKLRDTPELTKVAGKSAPAPVGPTEPPTTSTTPPTTPAATAAAPARAGRTFVLVVGVNAYDDKRIPPLAFAEADAREVYAFYATDPRSPTDPDRVQLLVGKDVTRPRLLRAIREHLAQKAVDPTDTAVLYFAGHGFADSKSTYLACSDTELDSLPETGVSAETLQAAWSGIQAGKVLFLDACHSGGLGSVRGIGGVALSPGPPAGDASSITVTATGPNELSTEDSKLGHGIFTIALLKALRGAADADRDGRVDGEELDRFLAQEVPRLAAATSAQQTPHVARVNGARRLYLTR